MTERSNKVYPIGVPGQVWQEIHSQAWFNAQTIKRSYQDEVLSRLALVDKHFVKRQYGSLPINQTRYPLYAFTSANWQLNQPTVLITGGVHGYETSGVQGAIDFLLNHSHAYLEQYNFIVAPCVSPWGYETINRWNQLAIDPNRSFHLNSPSPEADCLINFVTDILQKLSAGSAIIAHIDLHETTNTDNSEFRPALAARDGKHVDQWDIPDGFYTVADTAKPQLPFQQAVIEAVKKVTHIAPADNNNKLIGSSIIGEGIIAYDKKALHLCAGFTNAPFVTTTEVYPDSPNATPEICIEAQVAAIKGALHYLLTI